MPAGQKRAPDLIPDGCEPPYGCWELNSGPLEEQAILLISEPSLQPQGHECLSRLCGIHPTIRSVEADSRPTLNMMMMMMMVTTMMMT